MLRIQVLGNGLIPRGHGIAPKKEPFPADLRLIGIILSTGGLKVNFVHPDSGKLIPLNRENYQDMYAKYQNRVYTKAVEVEGNYREKEDAAEVTTSPVAPVVETPAVDTVPETPVAPVVETPAVDTVPETPVAPPVVEEAQATDAAKKTEEFTMKPIVAPEEKPKNFPNNNNNRNQQNGQRR